MMALTITVSLAACSKSESTSVAEKASPTAETKTDQVTDEQAKGDEDYVRLNLLVTDLQNHQDLAAKISTITEQVKNGEATKEDWLAVMKELTDDSKNILAKIEEAKWQTEYYVPHVEALTNAVTSLAAIDDLTYITILGKLFKPESMKEDGNLKQVPVFFHPVYKQDDLMLDFFNMQCYTFGKNLY